MGMYTNTFLRAELYRQTAIGRSLVPTEREVRKHVNKLVYINCMKEREKFASSHLASIAKL